MVGINKEFAAPNASSKALSLDEPAHEVAPPFVLLLPNGMPYMVLRCAVVRVGGMRVVLVTDRNQRLRMVCAGRLTTGLVRFLRRADFDGAAAECGTLELMLNCGYVMATYDLSDWLTREVRTALELRRHVAQLFSAGAVDKNSAVLEGGGVQL